MSIARTFAAQRGFTEAVTAEGGGYLLNLFVRPDTDFDSSFEAFCADEMEFVTVNGWLFDDIQYAETGR